MNEIPKELFVTRSVHKNIGMDPNNSILSCGFIHHTRHLSQNENLLFKYYGALLLLSGEGTYIDKDGKAPGSIPDASFSAFPMSVIPPSQKRMGNGWSFLSVLGTRPTVLCCTWGFCLRVRSFIPVSQTLFWTNVSCFMNSFRGLPPANCRSCFWKPSVSSSRSTTCTESRLLFPRPALFWTSPESCSEAAGSPMTAAEEWRNISGSAMRISARCSAGSFTCRPTPI